MEGHTLRTHHSSDLVDKEVTPRRLKSGGDGAAISADQVHASGWSTASTGKNQIKGWLMHERRVELGFESQRFNDLKRWGIAKQVLTALGK